MKVDKKKLPLNIGDRVSMGIDGRGTIVAYYFPDEFNDYSTAYGYTIKRDDHIGHTGDLGSFDENGNKVKFPEEGCWYYNVEEVELIKTNNIMNLKEIKAGMLVEVEDTDKSEDSVNTYLCIITYNNSNELVLSSPLYWCPLDCFNNKKLTYNIGYNTIKIMKIYDRTCARFAFSLNANDRILLWERPKEQIELTMDEIASKFGIDVSQLKIKK